MIKLSVVIIAYNEEKNLDRCLNSVKSVADEIVVLDSFSTDTTEQICRNHGVKFFQHKFDGHIQQKNRAVTYASNPHVLSLDADEALDEQLASSIAEVKKNFTKDGYYMNRLTNYCGHWVKHCGWYPDTKLRLWDSRKGAWTGINPHDKYELFEGDKNTGFLKGDILHYSYYSVEDHYRQVEYFTNIASKAYFEKGKKAGAFKLVVNPVAKFIDHYLLRLGFLDGKAGFLISRISAYATYLKYKKLRELYHQTASR
ncbi:MAG: putative glucosyl-3-phosphoglycerate synthase [Bacteroidetes bacterium]|nr:putative glucosyl-3-phosphoglycerate synthase [Bacteroidota bacterium]